MKALKGSKTHENLKAAFAGESQANRRYLYFAAKADVEGQNDVSALFRSTDAGRSWGQPVLLGKHFNETGLAVLPDGSLLAAMRSEKGGHLAVTRSGDQGRTWSAPDIVTKDNEHPADEQSSRARAHHEADAHRGAHAPAQDPINQPGAGLGNEWHGLGGHRYLRVGRSWPAVESIIPSG